MHTNNCVLHKAFSFYKPVYIPGKKLGCNLRPARTAVTQYSGILGDFFATEVYTHISS